MAPLTLPSAVSIIEVGPRDGLQNEDTPLSTRDKIAFVDTLSRSGLRHIEVTAFVNPTRIPQLADAVEVAAGITRAPDVVYSALVPNMRGYERAREANIDDIAIFMSASETHNQRNIGCSVDEAFIRFESVMEAARRDGVRVRGYVSTAFGCPYEGHVPIEQVVAAARRLIDIGCIQISLGDTTGMGNPVQVTETIDALAVPSEQVALHLHDTRGTALANAVAGLLAGVRTFDASAGGLGGCPYAPGATGNVATDEMVAMFESMGVSTGVDVEVVMQAAEGVGRALNKELPSRYIKASRAVTT